MEVINIETLVTLEYEGAWHGPGSVLTVPVAEWERLKAAKHAKRAKRRQPNKSPTHPTAGT